jgi:hypothetical protein
MEGVACWSALQMRRRRTSESPAVALDRLRNNRKWWSQEEGLALLLLLDRFAPGWPPRLLSPEVPSPVDLLRQSLAVQAAR